MKTIKFDLPIDGVKVATGDELRSHFTTEVLDHFRSDVLAKWLRTRPDMSAELNDVEKLAADGEDKPTLLALCKAFGVDADEHAVEAALAVATGVPPSSSASLANKRLQDGQSTGNLPPGGEERLHLDVLAPAFVQVQVRASTDMACTLENERGLQLATDGTIERKRSTSFAAVLSRGTYYIRLRAVESTPATYDIRVSQDQEVSKSDLVAYGDTPFGRAILPPTYWGEERLGVALKVGRKDWWSTMSIKELSIDVRRGTRDRYFETMSERQATLTAGCADLWIVDVPGMYVDIRTTGKVDTVGRLLGPDGDILGENDDKGKGRNFRIEPSKAMWGEFAVLVFGYDSKEKGNYRIQVRQPSGSRRRTSESRPMESHGLRIVWDEYSKRPVAGGATATSKAAAVAAAAATGGMPKILGV